MSKDVTCATCGSTYPAEDMTTCDECGAALCPYDARTITSEDVVCPACYAREVARARRADPGAYPNG